MFFFLSLLIIYCVIKLMFSWKRNLILQLNKGLEFVIFEKILENFKFDFIFGSERLSLGIGNFKI